MLRIVPSSRSENVERFIPLKSVTVHVDIQSFAADVRIQQIFTNSEETSSSIEAIYCFPIEEQAAIYEFKACLDDGREIQAEIKEKKKAQREYCNALRKGHGAFLLEQDEKSNDIFTISIGALKPQTTCKIEIRYVQELELINDGERIQFVLPTTIAPRYSSSSVGKNIDVVIPGSTTSKYVQSAPYTIEFFCSIKSLPIVSITSPSHPIQILSEQSSKIIDISLNQINTHLDRDIILNLDLKQQQIHTFTQLEKQAIMISFVPTLELFSDPIKINSEYLFIVDCSGSMKAENKIDYARQAMIIFLKSLPFGSYFNIFRFGSDFEQFKKNEITIEYNEQSAEQANHYINRMKADLGGTELFSVLDYLKSRPPRANYSRQLFLLTDGEIEDVDAVMRLCHSMSNTTRIFSFGLGSAPSRALVKGLARTSNGSFLFIPPKTHVDVAVARQLAKIFEPCLMNVKVKCQFDNDELIGYHLSPKTLPPIYAKQRINTYVMMPKIIENTLTGSIEFLTDKNVLLERVTFTQTPPSTCRVATRLAVKSLINDFQANDCSSRQTRFDDINKEQKIEQKQAIIDLSIQHQILSPFTAFVGIETRSVEEKMAASTSNTMVLREVPIEIRASNRLSSSSDCSDDDVDDMSDEQDFIVDDCDNGAGYHCLKRRQMSKSPRRSRSRSRSPRRCSRRRSPSRSRSHRWCPRRRSPSRSFSPRRRSQKRSRSCSPRRRSRSKSNDEHVDDNKSSTVVRQIITLQNVHGLWSKSVRQQVIAFFEESKTTMISQNIRKMNDLEKILTNFEEIDGDVMLSMLVVLVLMKYFVEDEPLWTPIVKKSIKTMENRLGGKQAYNELTTKIEQLI